MKQFEYRRHLGKEEFYFNQFNHILSSTTKNVVGIMQYFMC